MAMIFLSVLKTASYVQSNSTASKVNVLVNYDVENKTLRR